MKYFILAITKAFDFPKPFFTPPSIGILYCSTSFFAIAAIILDNLLGTTIKINIGTVEVPLPYGYIYFLYLLALMIPGLSAGVRRLHDVGKSGWMMLLAFIPIIGGIWLLVLFVMESDPGDNKWGPNPNNIPMIDGDLLRM